MLNEELRSRVKAMVEKYRQRELDFMRVLPRFPDDHTEQQKPRIRVKAISRPWSGPMSS